MSESKDRDFLVCARADIPWAIPGSIFTKICERCFTRVMIAPSGQQWLREHPGAGIVCDFCVPLSQASPPSDEKLAAMLAEASTAVPNTWRTRN